MLTRNKILLAFFLCVLGGVWATQYVRVNEKEQWEEPGTAAAAVAAADIEEKAAGFVESYRGFSRKEDTNSMPRGDLFYSSCQKGYPYFGKLGELLRAWSPNEPDAPEGGVVERLQVSFDVWPETHKR